MKKFFASLFVLALLVAIPAFGQIAPSTLSGSFLSTEWSYQVANGHEVQYDMVYTQAGVVYAVFDPSTSQVELALALSAAQNQSATAGINSPPIIPLLIPGAIATGNNIQTVRTLADFSVNNGGSGATLATIPNLVVTCNPNSTYTFRAVLYVSLGAGGSKVDFGGPQSPVSVIADTQATGGTAIVYSSQQTAFISGPAGSNTTTVTKIIIEGTFTTNNGGNFVIQFAQNTGNAANSTVKAGSSLSLAQIP